MAKNNLHKFLAYESAISNPDCWAAFHEYSQRMCKEEQVLFLNDYKNFKLAQDLLDAATDEISRSSLMEDCKTCAEVLIKKYIKIGASRELNLSSETRDALLQKYELQKNNPQRSLFDDIVHTLHYQLRTETFEGFISSPIFEQFIAKSIPVLKPQQQTETKTRISLTNADDSEELRPMRVKLPGLLKKKRNSGSPVANSEPIENVLIEDKNMIIKNLMEDVAKKNVQIDELRKQLERERSNSEELRNQLAKARQEGLKSQSPVDDVNNIYLSTRSPNKTTKRQASPMIVRRNSPLNLGDNVEFKQ